MFKWIAGIIIAIVFVIAAFCVGFYLGREIYQDRLLNSVADCNRLLTLHMEMKKQEGIQSRKKLNKLQQGDNRALAEFGWKMFKVHGCSFCAFLETNGERKTVICKRPPDKTCIDGIEACLNSPAESEVESE